MKIENLIKSLQELAKKVPNAEVKLHHYNGRNLLFALRCINNPEIKDVVWLEDSSDIDMTEELGIRFDRASTYDEDELEFFTDLLDIGFTLEDIKEYLPDKYEYSKNFLEEHGLI